MANSFSPFWYVLASLALALLPAVLAVFTSYLKVSIVFGLLRSALGTQHTPGPVVVMALSLALTAYIMSPVVDQTVKQAEQVNLEVILKDPGFRHFSKLGALLKPWQRFLVSHSSPETVRSLLAIRSQHTAVDRNNSQAVDGSNIPVSVLLPSFVISELREAFAMGFVLLLPFLVIDLIVANVLVGMGMFMVSPAMISLPLKLLLFVMADGWLLLVRSLILSYQVTT
ncbi:MAG: flagellar biosynthetic protein FliP [Candidatus Dadabacteria bacterium]|nr:MAG: flagellar biosynthetic protein FliP [Candidatus Dadabacteria bacterium]